MPSFESGSGFQMSLDPDPGAKNAERAQKLFLRKKIENYDQWPSKNEEAQNFL